MIIGTSDGGAHLARDDAADWSSWFLRNWVLDREVWSLEEGIRQITHVPAAIIGLGDRGTLEPGRWADIMVFDPDRIDAGRKEFVRDLPGGAGRFKAWPEGVHATIVNGVPAIVDGTPTGKLPGQVTSPGASRGRLISTSSPSSTAMATWSSRPRRSPSCQSTSSVTSRAPNRSRVASATSVVIGLGFSIQAHPDSVGAPGVTVVDDSADAPVVARGGADPAGRLVDMDIDGIDRAALYPTYGLMIQGITDEPAAVAMCRAVNDWVADYCSHDTKRLMGVATLPMTSGEAALAEARRCIERFGFVGAWRRPERFEGVRGVARPGPTTICSRFWPKQTCRWPFILASTALCPTTTSAIDSMPTTRRCTPRISRSSK